eukprot:TRINITY_DN23834_c0_g1_i1.p1 TRINITY_DN23834_c0_g1~~TRINITY_DN23834_c0_g1_i1.p1  ORF type:complete len:446 (-),score=70.89 TRINITY_DN23834_c0_g1_i1:197-1534(-)
MSVGCRQRRIPSLDVASARKPEHGPGRPSGRHCLSRRRCLSSVQPVAVSLLAALVVQPVVANFAASLHSNYVVNLDFEGTLDEAASCDSGEDATCAAAAGVADAPATKVVTFAGGKRKFRCQLPSHRQNGTGVSADRSKFEKHFRAAKLAWLKGRCITLRKDYWTYEVCFGRKIMQYNKEANLYYSLGEHDPTKDALLSNGNVQELYTSGTENRTALLRYVCGSTTKTDRTLEIVEDRALLYNITVSGPQFCAWRGDGSEARDEFTEQPLMLSSLLEELRGTCMNYTQGWWTYEYCYPHTLRQYHLQGQVKDPIHTLGTLNGTAASQELDKVNMSLVKIKSALSNPRERKGVASSSWVIQQRMGGGAVCDETGRARTATLTFQCPSSLEGSTTSGVLVSIQEGQLCEYDVLIHTNLVCGHRKLAPMLPRGKEVIKCVPEPSRHAL